jgi:hypothetical protein
MGCGEGTGQFLASVNEPTFDHLGHYLAPPEAAEVIAILNWEVNPRQLQNTVTNGTALRESGHLHPQKLKEVPLRPGQWHAVLMSSGFG